MDRHRINNNASDGKNDFNSKMIGNKQSVEHYTNNQGEQSRFQSSQYTVGTPGESKIKIENSEHQHGTLGDERDDTAGESKVKNEQSQQH